MSVCLTFQCTKKIAFGLLKDQIVFIIAVSKAIEAIGLGATFAKASKMISLSQRHNNEIHLATINALDGKRL